MNSYSIDITNSQIFMAMGNFLKLIFPEIEVIQGQNNLVPIPKNSFISITQGKSKRLSTNKHSYTDLHIEGQEQGFKHIATPTEIIIDLNLYGKDSPNWVTILQNIFRDEFAYKNFPQNIKPLFMTDPYQLPLIDGEQQYNDRWKTSIHLMYMPTVNSSQQYFDSYEINIGEAVDIIYTI